MTMNPINPSDIVATAARLASAGRYQEALLLLDTATIDPPPIDFLLLRAKIFAQQEDFAAAVAEWNAVLATHPDHAEARRGVDSAMKLKDRAGRRFYLRANLYYAVLLATIAVLLLGLVFTLGRRAGFAAVESRLAERNETLRFSRQALEFSQTAVAHADEHAADATHVARSSVEAITQLHIREKVLIETLERIGERLEAADAALERRLAGVETTVQCVSGEIANYDNRLTSAESKGDHRHHELLTQITTIRERMERVTELVAAVDSRCKSVYDGSQQSLQQLVKLEKSIESGQKSSAAVTARSVDLLTQQAKATAGLDDRLATIAGNVDKTLVQDELIRREIQILRQDLSDVVSAAVKVRRVYGIIRAILAEASETEATGKQ